MNIIGLLGTTMAIALIIAIAMALWVVKKMVDSTFVKDDRDTKILKDEIKALQESVDQLYEDYQDIGKMFFDLREKADTVIEICKKTHETKETKALAKIIINTLKEKENKKGKLN